MAVRKPSIVIGVSLACEKFRVGDRVQLSHQGRARFGHRYAYGPDAKGTVRGYGRDTDTVRVQRDGFKAIVSYHFNDWTLIEEGHE